jgi:hypothetical protein
VKLGTAFVDSCREQIPISILIPGCLRLTGSKSFQGVDRFCDYFKFKTLLIFRQKSDNAKTNFEISARVELIDGSYRLIFIDFRTNVGFASFSLRQIRINEPITILIQILFACRLELILSFEIVAQSIQSPLIREKQSQKRLFADITYFPSIEEVAVGCSSVSIVLQFIGKLMANEEHSDTSLVETLWTRTAP